MKLSMLFPILGLLLPHITSIRCACYDPSPAAPPPDFDLLALEFDQAISNIAKTLNHPSFTENYTTTSFSLEITSSRRTLFTHYHTAPIRNTTRPGAPTVDGTSAYRIASITKAFTVLAILQQHAAGTLHLDSPVIDYLPALAEKQSGTLPWKDITLRALGSQLSGIPGDVFQDMVVALLHPEALGLPPMSRKGLDLPTCNGFSESEPKRPCDEKDLIRELMKQKPNFAPAQQSSYCNVGFEILGLVLESVTGLGYSEYIHKMLKELGIEGISFERPGDEVAVLPKGEAWYWYVEQGVMKPTGGLYSGSSSLSAFLRYVLTHYNGITTGALNWLHPSSYSHGLRSSYGMPWEIFRTEHLLKDTAKPVTFVTKSGGVPGYTSNIIMVPEYDLGITILVAGKGKLLDEIRDVVSRQLIPIVELLAQSQMHAKYAGTYTAAKKTGLDSSLELSHSPTEGLYVSILISNGTDVMEALLPFMAGPGGDFDFADWRLQLVPTLLFADPEKQAGEIWRALLVPQKRNGGVWDDFCNNMYDSGVYAGKKLNELVFWTDGEGAVERVELSAFFVDLYKESRSETSTWPVAGGEDIPVISRLQSQMYVVLAGKLHFG